jgi:porin
MRSLGLFFVVVIFSIPLVAQQPEQESTPRLGSADQVNNRLDLDKLIKQPVFELSFLDPYFDFKDKVNDKTGLSFALDYTSIYFGSNSQVGEGNAGGGIFRFYGSWDLVGKKSGNTGALVYKLEHRHKYTTIPVSGLGLDMGFAGMIGPPYNDSGYRTQNLYWRQRFARGRATFVAGFLDVTDFFDVYALASPWMHFTNFNFSTGIAAVNVPNDGYLGAAIGGWITNRIYVIGGIADQNGNPGNVFNGFETLFSKGEIFKHIEIGYTSAKDYMLLDNMHLTFWHRDATSATGDPSGWGLVLSGTKYINEKVLPFFRFAYTKDGGSFLQTALATGIGYQPIPGSHLLAAAYSWGRPNETTFGEGLTDQHLFEVFYRLQLSSRIAITPDIQFIINPALNNQQSSIFVYGIRGRISL